MIGLKNYLYLSFLNFIEEFILHYSLYCIQVSTSISLVTHSNNQSFNYIMIFFIQDKQNSSLRSSVKLSMYL